LLGFGQRRGRRNRLELAVVAYPHAGEREDHVQVVTAILELIATLSIADRVHCLLNELRDIRPGAVAGLPLLESVEDPVSLGNGARVTKPTRLSNAAIWVPVKPPAVSPRILLISINSLSVK